MSEKRVAMIGAGLMGHALALVHGLGGCRVALYDVSAAQIDKAMVLIENALRTMAEAGAIEDDGIAPVMARIEPVPELAGAVEGADLVVEAVVEDVEVKREVFAAIASSAPERAIIASNTSHLDVFPLIPQGRQRRAMIAHWYSPPYIIDLVDLAPGPETEPEVMAAMRALYLGMGKKPVLFKTFITGYVANRLQSAISLEIMRLLDEGLATAEAIDESIKYGLATRMAIMGQLMKTDFAGLDMARRAMANRTYEPPEVTTHSATLEKLIADGKQGVMSGSGFFDYGGKSPETLFKERDVALLKLKAAVAEVEDEIRLTG